MHLDCPAGLGTHLDVGASQHSNSVNLTAFLSIEGSSRRAAILLSASLRFGATESEKGRLGQIWGFGFSEVLTRTLSNFRLKVLALKPAQEARLPGQLFVD